MSDFNAWLVGGGLAVGAVFAFFVQRYRFCLVAATSNWLLIRDYRQALAFAAALVVAITGTQLLEIFEIVDVADSMYRNDTLDWFGVSVGGFIFGIGTTLAGGCATRTLVRTMEGSLHSLIALVTFFIVAAVVQFGFLESVRIKLTHVTAVTLTTDAGIGSILSLSPWIVMLGAVVGLIVFIVKGWQRSPDKSMLIVGSVIGSLVVLGWCITGMLAQDEFAPVAPSSITMSGPFARFGYFFLSGRVAALSFAVSFVIGVAIFSLLFALVSRQFKITAPAKGMAKMALLGGALMGIGSIMAYGCNIGQGMSGMSTLSLESLIAAFAMLAGVSVMTKWMENH